MKKILVIQTRVGIGDLCIFLPCIHQIAKKNKDFELHLLTKKRSCAKDFLKYDKHIKKIFYLPEASGIKLNFFILKFMKQNVYNTCFIMHYGLRYYLLSLISNIKRIYFYGIIKKNENIVKKSQKSTIQWLGNNSLNFKPIIFYQQNIKKKNQITFGIGGSGLNKKWNIKKYIQLAKLINSKKKVEILLAGGIEEINDSLYIKEKLNEENINTKSLCEKKISECMDYLIQSKIYVGNDTGFMHISASLGLQSYGLFGDTPPNYASYNKKIIPILPQGEKIITHGSKMMSKINADYVFKTLDLELI